MLKVYLQKISETAQQGDAREESFYPTLKDLLKEKRVYINEKQYFEGVKQEVWYYQIGGYQVLQKWLEDRKKHILNLDDINHYCRVVTALAKTIEIQAEIDALYPEVEKETLAISNG